MMSSYSYLSLFLVLTFIACEDGDTESPAMDPAQVIEDSITYIDYTPPMLLGSTTYFDIDTDGVDDFYLSDAEVWAGSSPSGGPYYDHYFKINTLSDQVMTSFGHNIASGAPYDYECLFEGDTIDESLSWSPSASVQYQTIHGTVVTFGAVGVWDHSAHDGYIGISKTDSNASRYGWIKVGRNFSSLPNIFYEVYGMAYQHAPDTPIETGQTE